MNEGTTLTLHPVSGVHGRIGVPGDKSVSHRALLFGAIADGVTDVTNLLSSGDVQSTANCLRAMGVGITGDSRSTRVSGLGLHGLKASPAVLDCGNSGTTIRILMGLLAGQGFDSTLTGDDSLRRRPMKRVAEPLRRMGARIELTQDGFAPLTVRGTKLHAVDYELKIASAQVKTSLLMAGLYADGMTTLRGALGSRDHTERLLPHFGVRLEQSSERIAIRAGQTLRSTRMLVPGDPSSAAFWMGAACLFDNQTIEITGASLNPTRTGFMEVLRRMGARIESQVTQEEPEPIGDVRVSARGLRGVEVSPDEVPSLIDEIPLLAVLAARAEWETIVRGAEELRVKESDRIDAMADNLRRMGVDIETFKDGFRIRGPQKLGGAKIDSFHDHRVAMSFAIASLVAEGATEIRDVDCVGISYPEFFDVLQRVRRA